MGLKDEASDRGVEISAGPGFTAVVYGQLENRPRAIPQSLLLGGFTDRHPFAICRSIAYQFLSFF